MKTTIPAALALAAAFVVGSAGAAPAVVLGTDDARGDVWQEVEDPGSSTWVASGTQFNTDLERSVAKHGVNNVVLTQHFKNLRRVGDGLASVWWIKTDQRRRFVAVVNTRPGDTVGQVYVGASRGSARVAGRVGEPPTQEGCPATHEIDYREDTVRIVFSRECVGGPTWIKAQPFSQSVDDEGRYYLDNGQDGGHTARGWTRRVERGRPDRS